MIIISNFESVQVNPSLLHLYCISLKSFVFNTHYHCHPSYTHDLFNIRRHIKLTKHITQYLLCRTVLQNTFQSNLLSIVIVLKI